MGGHTPHNACHACRLLPAPPLQWQPGVVAAGIRRELPWLKLVVSMREPISAEISGLVHRMGKQAGRRCSAAVGGLPGACKRLPEEQVTWRLI